MPARPSWYPRIPDILAEVEAMTIPVLDRSVIERLFGLRRRRSITLLHEFGGYQVGRTFLVPRQAVVDFLHRTQGGEAYDREERRRARLVESLEHIRRHRAAAQVHIPAAPDVWERTLGGLPEGIELRQGEMRITFDGAEDLLRKLLEVSQAAANDFETFRKVTG